MALPSPTKSRTASTPPPLSSRTAPTCPPSATSASSVPISRASATAASDRSIAITKAAGGPLDGVDGGEPGVRERRHLAGLDARRQADERALVRLHQLGKAAVRREPGKGRVGAMH